MNKDQKASSDRKFFFMVACQVVFHVAATANEPEAMNTAFINGVVTNDVDQFPSRLVGKAQQVAQMHFFKRLGDEAKNVNVVDVVIMGIMNLGFMTDEEFQAVPEGVRQQERKAPSLSVVSSTPANDPLEAAIAIANGAPQ